MPSHCTLLFFTVMCYRAADARFGAILNFDPPDANEEVEEVILKRKDIDCFDLDGSTIRNRKLSMFWLEVNKHCYESNNIRKVTPCENGEFYVMNLRYGDNFLLDCMRVYQNAPQSIVSSIRPVVLVRFHLKVYYLMRSGKCFYKYFSMPFYTCSEQEHYELDQDKCNKMFPEEHDFTKDLALGPGFLSVTPLN